MPESQDSQEELYNGGVCPVCGEEFVDGFDALGVGKSYEAKVCIEEVGDDGEGKCLIHLPGVGT
jgi:hypothetical protein